MGKYKCNRNEQYKTNTFLPMLCSKPSKQDILQAISKSNDEDRCVLRVANGPLSPLSPKISCIGQIKRTKKIAGVPINNKSKNNNNNNAIAVVKYSKLRSFFSGKNLNREMKQRTAKCSTKTASNGAIRVRKIGDVKEKVVKNIAEMDPPLPVKRVDNKKSSDECERNNLWKRRSGGAALGSLQLQQVRVNKPSR